MGSTYSTMPGHVKLGKAGEPDPDPLPYLVVSMETRREDQNLEYDPKKMYWCPDGKHAYMKSILLSDEGGKATVQCGHESSAGPKIVLYLKFIAHFGIEIIFPWRYNYESKMVV